MDIPWSAYPLPLEKQRGGSRVLAVINKAAVNIHVHISLGIYFSFLQNKYPKMQLLDPLIRIDVLKKKKKTAKLFPRVAMPFSNPRSNIWVTGVSASSTMFGILDILVDMRCRHCSSHLHFLNS